MTKVPGETTLLFQSFMTVFGLGLFIGLGVFLYNRQLNLKLRQSRYPIVDSIEEFERV